MIPLTQFVGAFLHQLTSSRRISDQASVKVANEYLEDDMLRGFPVPRMTFDTVELDFCFAVAPLPIENLKNPLVRKNITNRLGQKMADLHQSPDFKDLFQTDLPTDATWRDNLAGLQEDVEHILQGPVSDNDTLNHMLSLAVENFFHNIHNIKPDSGFLGRIKSFFSGHVEVPEDDGDAHSDATIRQWAHKMIDEVVQQALPTSADPASTPVSGMHILVGGSELEGQNTDMLHRAKISFKREDRKWVSSEKGGKKQYILDR